MPLPRHHKGMKMGYHHGRRCRGRYYSGIANPHRSWTQNLRSTKRCRPHLGEHVEEIPQQGEVHGVEFTQTGFAGHLAYPF